MFVLRPSLERWYEEHRPTDINAGTRQRVVRHFTEIAARARKEPVDALRGFYAGLRTECLLAPSTCCTYVKYVINDLRLPRHHYRVRDVLRVAELEHARATPVRPCMVAPEEALLDGVRALEPGPIRRAAILMLATGARCADVAKLRRDEVFVEEQTDESTRLHVAWSEQKARKSYSQRTTIRYPSALIGSQVTELLQEVAGYDGAPCVGVTATKVNAALSEAGVDATTRTFRVCFIDAPRYRESSDWRLGAPA